MNDNLATQAERELDWIVHLANALTNGTEVQSTKDFRDGQVFYAMLQRANAGFFTKTLTTSLPKYNVMLITQDLFDYTTKHLGGEEKGHFVANCDIDGITNGRTEAVVELGRYIVAICWISGGECAEIIRKLDFEGDMHLQLMAQFIVDQQHWSATHLSLVGAPKVQANNLVEPAAENEAMGQVFPLGYIAIDTGMAVQPTRCWICGGVGDQNDLFKPCMCDTFSHRSTCFRKWRQGWINPRNYFSCPNCMHRYNLERVKPSTTESEEEIKRHYRCEIVKLWLGLLLFFVVIIGTLATIIYFCDPNKNVPVATKYMLTSVLNGFPDKNSTDKWREDFKRDDVPVWHYYTLIATFIVSLCVLIAFAFMGCTFDEEERRKQRRCCEDCGGMQGCYCDCMYIDCSGASPRICNCDCKAEKCDCDSDSGPIIAIIVIIIVIVVIFSAIFVVILYACQKCALLYDRVTHMLMSQQEELEGETVVLAVNETWRPTTSV